MGQGPKTKIPPDLRHRLETARLDLLALLRALDRMDLRPAEIPQHLLQKLFELDADCAEALWALDQPPRSLDCAAMLHDTEVALKQITVVASRFRMALASRAHPALENLEISIRQSLDPREAYNQVPGRTLEGR
jgi:hypothetical protein